MLYVIGAIILGGIIFAILNRNNPEPPPILETEEDLMIRDGLTRTQARRELRAQRGEQRQAQRLRNNNIRVANSLTKSVIRMAKKRK